MLLKHRGFYLEGSVLGESELFRERGTWCGTSAGSVRWRGIGGMPGGGVICRRRRLIGSKGGFWKIRGEGGMKDPELKNLDWRTRNRVQSRRMPMSRRGKVYVWASAVMTVLIVFDEMLLDPLPDAWQDGIKGALLLGVSLLLLLFFKEARSLRRQNYQAGMLEENRMPAQCFECGYDLTGCTSSTCPECGCVLLEDETS